MVQLAGCSQENRRRASVPGSLTVRLRCFQFHRHPQQPSSKTNLTHSPTTTKSTPASSDSIKPSSTSYAAISSTYLKGLGDQRQEINGRCRMETQIHVPVGSPVIRKIPIFVDEHNVTEGAMKLIKELRPAWDSSDVRTKVTLSAKLAAQRVLGQDSE